MNTQPQKVPRILVIGPSWAGDMVMAQSLFIVLKQRHPEAAIDVLAPSWSNPLLNRMPEVNKVVEMPIGHGRLAMRERWRLGRELSQQHYDQAILLPNSLKSALIPLFARIPRRTGWVGEMRYGLLNDARILDKNHLSMMVQRFVALALEPDEEELPPIPAPALRVQPEDVHQALADLNLTRPQAKMLALCPGAEFGPSKRWPETHYAELASRYLARDWEVWLFGSAKDQPVCAAVDRLCGNACTNLSGSTQLAQAVDLLTLASAAVCNDSGLMHVVAALNRPLVAVYGSTDPGFTPPLNTNSRVVRLGLDCSPCFKRECPLGHLRCLTELQVDLITAALEELGV